MSSLSPTIFKAYDIRGVLGKTLDAGIARQIGLAFAASLRARGEHQVVIGRDGRLSSPQLSQALADGLRSGGLDVVDIGLVTTPMLYFATHELGPRSGVMVTGSHNPPDYNGFKMVLDGQAIYGDAIAALYRALENGTCQEVAAAGSYRVHDIREAYLQRIAADIRLARPMKVAVDCGNGVAGAFAGQLYRRLGCEVTELFCEVDGNFPNHHPDPAQPENLQALAASLAQGGGEIGLAFDGDADRLGVVTHDGQVIYPDRQLMLFARDVLTRHPGRRILYDVKCTRHLAPWIREHGGEPMICQTGHSLVKARMHETGAPLGGELSGHLFFKDRWYGFDDGLYAGARLLELLSREADPSACLNALPQAISTPELHLDMEEGASRALVEQLAATGKFAGAEHIIDIDGLRVEYADGFGLARPSNTTPVVVLRFEAETPAALARVQHQFRQAIESVKPGAQLPF